MHYWALRIHQRRFGLKKLKIWMKWAFEDGSWTLILGMNYPYLELEGDWPISIMCVMEGTKGILGSGEKWTNSIPATLARVES